MLLKVFLLNVGTHDMWEIPSREASDAPTWTEFTKHFRAVKGLNVVVGQQAACAHTRIAPVPVRSN